MPRNAAGRRLCVYITAVRLYCFRSYTELRFEPAKGLNVIVGANAAGKTNILESVFLAALGRSHRTRRDAELINPLSDKAYAGIELVSATGKHSIELKLFSGAPKQVFIDGQRIRRMGELMGVLNAVMFSPEDLSLVKDSPETRRRFMDMELCQLRPAYFYRLQQYNAALKQRTALLKTSFPFEPNIELLDMWDDKLAELGGSVMLLRRDSLDRLSTAARDLNRSITGNSSDGHEPEELFTYYKPYVPFEGDGARAALGDALCKARAEDIRRGCIRCVGAPEKRFDEDALRMLRALSGRAHTVCTGVSVRRGAQEERFAVSTRVFFRPMTDDEIRAYIKTGEPMDKAGAYGVQSRGALFVERIDGDFFNVMGLPVEQLGLVLARFGVKLL